MQIEIISTGEIIASEEFYERHPRYTIPLNDEHLADFDARIFVPPPEPPAVPASVTMRQARLALLQAGLLDDVAAAIDALPSPDKEAARIEWEYSQVVERHRPFVATLGAAIGLDDAALDTMFLIAQTL